MLDERGATPARGTDKKSRKKKRERKPKRKLFVLSYVAASKHVDVILSGVKKATTELAKLASPAGAETSTFNKDQWEQRWHIFFDSGGERAMNEMHTKAQEELGAESAYLSQTELTFKESGGRQQDDLIGKVSLEMWDAHAAEVQKARKGQNNKNPERYPGTVIVLVGLPDADGALLEHISDMLLPEEGQEDAPSADERVYLITDTPRERVEAEHSALFSDEMAGRFVYVQLQEAVGDAVPRTGVSGISKAPGGVRMSLAWEHREKVLERIEASKVTILSGPTGCGKSTIIPLMLWQAKERKRAGGRILVAQPRRLPVVSLCERVQHLAREMEGQVANAEISFCIGGDDRTDARTTMEFVTYGVLVNKLCGNPRLEGYTHVFLDEIHERQLDMDLSVGLILPALTELGKKDDLKLIMMSATCSVVPMWEHLVAEGRKRSFAGLSKDDVFLCQLDYKHSAGQQAAPDQYPKGLRREELVGEGGHAVDVRYINDAWDELGNGAHRNYGSDEVSIPEAVRAVTKQRKEKQLCYVLLNAGEPNEVFALVEEPESLAGGDVVPPLPEGPVREGLQYLADERRKIAKEEAQEFAQHFVLRGKGETLQVAQTVSGRAELRSRNALPSWGEEAVPALHCGRLLAVLEHAVPNNARVKLAANLARKEAENSCRKEVGAGRNILVFLPGLKQIRDVREVLAKEKALMMHVDLHELHSSHPLLVQKLVMEGTKIKVVLATSTAESSLTIPDVGVVIDCCLGRYEKEEAVIVTERSSRDAAHQRAGRTGRTCPGTVYRLITRLEWALTDMHRRPEIGAGGLAAPLRRLLASRSFHEGSGEYSPLNILRRSVTRDVLRRRAGAGGGDGGAVPEEEGGYVHAENRLLEGATASLEHEGSLERVDGETVPPQVRYRLTRLGQLQAALPLSGEWARFLYVGCKLGVGVQCAVAAAMCSTASMFFKSGKARPHSELLAMCSGTYSDPVASVEVMGLYLSEKEAGGADEQVSATLPVAHRSLEEARVKAESTLGCLGRFLDAPIEERVPEDMQCLSKEEKKLIMFAWAAAFCDNAAKFLPQKQTHQKANRPKEVDVEKRALSVVLTIPGDCPDGVKGGPIDQLLKDYMNLNEGDYVTKRLGPHDWEYGTEPTPGTHCAFVCACVPYQSSTPSTQFLITFTRGTEDKPLVYGLDRLIWLAEKYSSDTCSVMSLERWRTHSDFDRWVSYGKIELANGSAGGGAKLNFHGVSNPILSDTPLLLLPSAVYEFRETVEDESLSARNACLLPASDHVLPLLSALMTHRNVRKAFQYNRIEFTPTRGTMEIPDDWHTVYVCGYEIDSAPGTWIRSDGFQKLRKELCCADTPDINDSKCLKNVKDLRKLLEALLKQIGYADEIEAFLEDGKQHEELLKKKRGTKTVALNVNECTYYPVDDALYREACR